VNVYLYVLFLGAFAKLRKPTISFIISASQSAWNNSAPTGRILMKIDIGAFFENLLRKFQVSLKFGKINGYFT
jgi:hypothetical protein